MFDAAPLMSDCPGDCVRLARGARFLDDAAAFVDDTDVRLIEGHIEANKKFHSLNSLIGCNEGYGHNATAWCKARSAHLYRQAQIYSRQGIDLDRSTLAAWVGRAAFELTPVYEALLANLKRSSKLFMPSRQHASHAPAGQWLR